MLMKTNKTFFHLTSAKAVIAFLIAIVTPMLYFSDENARGKELQQRQATLSALAEQIVFFFENDINTKINSQLSLAHSKLFKTTPINSPQLNQALQNYQAQNPEYIWVGVADTRGIIRSDSPPLLVGVDASERPWFKGGFNNSFFGDVHTAVLLQNLLPKNGRDTLRMVDISNPIYDDKNNLKGVLSAHLDWTWAENIIRENWLKSSDNRQIEIFLINAEDNVLYSSSGQDLPLGKNILKTNQDYLISTKALNIKSAKEDGQWKVLIRQMKSLSEISPPSSPLWFFGFLITTLSLLYLIVGYFIFRRHLNSENL